MFESGLAITVKKSVGGGEYEDRGEEEVMKDGMRMDGRG